MQPFTIVVCAKCGTKEELGPGFSLPETGGALAVQGDVVQEFICGPCWAARPSTDWLCPGCSRANPDGRNWCLACQTYRPDPRPHVPDWEALALDEEERERDAANALVEAIREVPGYPWLGRAGRRL